MKINLLIFLILLILVFQTQESFSEDYFSLPSCDKGVFVQDHIQCSTGETPPCELPSFEKNGYCAVKKIDICKTGSVLKNGLCIENNEFYRVDDATFARQSLQTGETLGDSLGWFGLGMSAFIVIAYVIMKINRRKKENE